ncbi:MAG: hypothetical protein DPW09_04910 [Anaerolineae bacterium]|nr:hypothetical protein [Anaerolineae bacterium]
MSEWRISIIRHSLIRGFALHLVLEQIFYTRYTFCNYRWFGEGWQYEKRGFIYFNFPCSTLSKQLKQVAGFTGEQGHVKISLQSISAAT